MRAHSENNVCDAQTADALIVGQGIAGSLLGWVLHKRGLRILIVDDGHKSSASTVAAGMINPVQGQRLNTIWEIEKCLPAAMALYRELETHFNQRFFHPKKIVRVLKDAAQADILQTRLADPTFAPYFGAVEQPGCPYTDGATDHSNQPAPAVADTAAAGSNTGTDTPVHTGGNAPTGAPATTDATADGHAATPAGASTPSNADTDANALCAPHGSVEITGGGYLDTQALLHALRDFFRSEGILVEASLAYSDLSLSDPHCVRWHGHAARRVIFAEGWRILDNPFFAGHRFLATKGQILSVQTAEPLPDYVVNQGKWLVPQAEREAWIGATFERGIADMEVTAGARAEILADVQALIPRNRLSVSAQRAGVRLATPDHIPRIGFLPTEPRIGIFSAFASKGNCLAPYLAQCMAEHICNATTLPARADIASKKSARAVKPSA